MFSNIVVARTSYTFREIIVGAKFNSMFQRSQKGDKTILYLDKLNSYTPPDISYAFKDEKIIG